MKQLAIVFILFFLCVFAKAQFPATQYMGNQNTLVKSKGAFGSDSGYVYAYSFPDTATANRGFLKNIGGITITVGNDIYIRTYQLNKWIKVGEASVSQPANQIVFGSGVGISSSPNFQYFNDGSISNVEFNNPNTGLNVLNTYVQSDSVFHQLNDALGNSMFIHQSIADTSLHTFYNPTLNEYFDENRAFQISGNTRYNEVTVFSNRRDTSGFRLFDLRSTSPTKTGSAIGVDDSGYVVRIAGGGSQNLQQVTDIGSTTTNGITAENLTSLGDFTIGDDMGNSGAIMFYLPSGGNVALSVLDTTYADLGITIPKLNLDHPWYVPFTINGEYADEYGNITIPTGSSQNLQDVLDNGSTLDKDNTIDVNGNNLSFTNVSKFKIESSDSTTINSINNTSITSDIININTNSLFFAKQYNPTGDPFIFLEDGASGIGSDSIGGGSQISINPSQIYISAKDSIVIANKPDDILTNYKLLVRDEVSGKIGITSSGGSQNLQQVTDIDSVTTHTIAANSLQLDITPTTNGTNASNGEFYWDNTYKTGSLVLDSTNGVILQIGQEQQILGVNKTGSTLTNGTVVFIRGAQGNRPKIEKAHADSVVSSFFVGVVTQDIANNQEGYVTTQGIVHGINTTGLGIGDNLYLSATTAGTFSNTHPVSPNNVVRIGVALNSTVNGSIYVNATSPVSADTLFSENSDEISITQKAARINFNKKVNYSDTSTMLSAYRTALNALTGNKIDSIRSVKSLLFNSPSTFTLNGTTGVITETLASQAANSVFRTTTAGTPSFGMLDSTHVPALHSEGYYNTKYSPLGIGTTLGTIINETFANLSSWTSSGSPTTSVSGGWLSITDAASGNALSKYIYYSAYSWSDLRPLKIKTKIVVGTKSSTSYAPQIGLRGTRSMVAMVDLTSGANAGKILWYYNNSTTVYRKSTGALSISSGDTLDYTFEIRKDQYVVTVKNRATGANITDNILFSTMWSKPVHVPITYYPVIQAMGAAVHKIGQFVVNSDAPKYMDILEVGNSIVYGSSVSNVDNTSMAILNRGCNGVFFNYGAPGGLVEGINTAEVLSLAPSKIVIRDGVNNLIAGNSATTYMGKLRTLVNTLVSNGYVVGTNLFIGTLTPYSTSVVAYNDSIIAQYGSVGGVIDFYKTLVGSSATTFNSDYYAYDVLHYSDWAELAIANTYINFFDLIKRPYSNTQLPVTYNDKGRLSIGRINAYPTQSFVFADPQCTISLRSDTTDNGAYLMSTGAGIFRAGAGVDYANSAFIAKTTNLGLFTMNNSTMSYLQKRGQTVGATTSLTGADAKLYINDSGFVGINTSTIDSTNYQLKVVGKINKSMIQLATASNSNTGAFITTLDAKAGTNNVITLSTGASFINSNWVYRSNNGSSTAGFITISNDSILFRGNSGLSDGQTFTPTYYGNMSSAGLRLGTGTSAATERLTVEGNLLLATAGNKIKITTGSNASIGTGTLSSGTATISTTAVAEGSQIFIQYTNCSNCGTTYIGTITAGTSFVVNSTNVLDASTFNWWIIN